MSKENTRLCVEDIGSVELDNNNANISAMILMEDKLFLADRKSNVLLMFDSDLRHIHTYPFTSRQTGYFWGLADLAVVEKHEFSVLVPGFFSKSEVWFFEVDDGEIKPTKTRKLKLDSRCFGICFQRNYFFATFAPRKRAGYVKMYDVLNGDMKKVFRPEELSLTRGLSKIYVDSQFRIFLSDENNRQLLVFKRDNFNDDKLGFEVSHKYSVKSMAVSKEGSSFFATSSEDGVILMHPGGRWIFNNFLPVSTLDGKSCAVAVKESSDEQILYVAVSKAKMFLRSSCKIVAFKLVPTKSTDVTVQLD